MSEVQFKEGGRVRYVPFHAEGNRHHADCEDGIVTSVKEKLDGGYNVFVRFGTELHSKACDPETLVRW